MTILAPVVRQKKGTYQAAPQGPEQGGVHAGTGERGDPPDRRGDPPGPVQEAGHRDRHRPARSTDDRSRLAEACENALKKSEEGSCMVARRGGEGAHSTPRSWPARSAASAFEELQPRMFSFNSPFGACEDCNGLGIKMEFDPDLIIPDKDQCIADGAVALYRNFHGRLPRPVPGGRGQALRVLGPHPHQGPHRRAVQCPDVRLRRADPVLHEHEERGRPVVAHRGMGGAPPPDRAALRARPSPSTGSASWRSSCGSRPARPARAGGSRRRCLP